MKNLSKRYLTTFVISQIMCTYLPAYGKTDPLINLASSQPDIFSYNASMYFYATHSGLKGERYLLNKELSKVQFDSDIRLNDWSKIHSSLIYNKNVTPLSPTLYFDEAYLEFKKLTASPWYADIGRKWLTFGTYKSDLIYKPLTKALAQTQEYTAILGYEKNDYYVNLSLFPPYTRVESAKLPLYYNLDIGLHKKNGFYSYDVGLSYLYSMADTQLFQYNKGFGGFLNEKIESHVPGTATYAHVKYKNLFTSISYVTAIHSFHKNDLSFQNQGAQPAAFHFQSGYHFNVKNIPLKIIGFYDTSFQALALQLPKERAGVGLNVYPNKYIDIQLQYSKDYGYKKDVEASGLNQTVRGNSTISNTAALQFVLYLR